MRAEVRGPGYTLVVVDGHQPPVVSDKRTIEVGYEVLRLDAVSSAFSEVLASLLLPPVEYDEELGPLVSAYRARVVAEEAGALASRLGEAGDLEVPLAYFPAARMSRLGNLYSCAFNEAVRDPESLGGAYAEHARALGAVEGGYVRLAMVQRRERRAGVAAPVNALLTGIAGLYLGFLSDLGRCRPSALLRDPLLLVRPPEGVLMSDCGGLAGLAEVLGASECSRSSLLFSTTVCAGPGGSVVVKDYAYGTLKWLLAGFLSLPAYPFRESPASRALNEYSSLRALRRVVRTPSVLALCVGQARSLLAREYVKGEVVMKSQDPSLWREAGRALAAIHRSGWALGDPNPGNFVVAGDGTYLIDAEQAGPFTPARGAWDLAVYFYYARFFGSPLELVRESLRAYAQHDPGLWEEVSSQLFSPGVLAFAVTLPPVLYELYTTVRSLRA